MFLPVEFQDQDGPYFEHLMVLDEGGRVLVQCADVPREDVRRRPRRMGVLKKRLQPRKHTALEAIQPWAPVCEGRTDQPRPWEGFSQRPVRNVPNLEERGLCEVGVKHTGWPCGAVHKALDLVLCVWLIPHIQVEVRCGQATTFRLVGS